MLMKNWIYCHGLYNQLCEFFYISILSDAVRVKRVNVFVVAQGFWKRQAASDITHIGSGAARRGERSSDDGRTMQGGVSRRGEEGRPETQGRDLGDQEETVGL